MEMRVHQLTRGQRMLRYLELHCLYVLPPLAVFIQAVSLWYAAALVFIASVLIGWLDGRARPRRKQDIRPDKSEVKRVIRLVMIRFGACAGMLTLLVLANPGSWLLGDRYAEGVTLFSFPRQAPDIWIRVFILYPLISVPIQEIPLRILFFRRYAVLFKDERTALWVNVLLFAWVHAPIGWRSFVLSLPAGYFFATTYLRTRRFWPLWLEHSLYGNFVFTIGLGRLFYYNPV